MRKNAGAWFAAITLLGAGGFAAPGRAMGQGAIAFQPTVGTVPDGVGLNVTPAVSADRRYVRLSLGFDSSTVQGFQNIPFPVGAVGGGGGQLGGLGGGGGGAFRSVLTGMNGPIAPGEMVGAAPVLAAGPISVATADPSFGEVQRRRPAPRLSRADRAKAERLKAAAVAKAAKPK